MNRMRSLIKAGMSEGMHIFFYRAKDEKSKKVLPLVLAACLWFSIFSYAGTMMVSLRETQAEYALLVMFTMFTAILTLIEGIYKSSSLLFSCKDNDLLLSLPLKKSEIVFLRLFKFYVFEVVYNALFITPAILIYMLSVKPSAEFLVVAVLMVMVLPIIPVVLASVAGALTTTLSLRASKKNLVQTLVTFVFLGAVMVFSFQMGRFAEDIGTIAGAMSERVVQVYYPARVVADLTRGFDVRVLAEFLVVNLAVVAVVVGVMGKFYFRIVSRVNSPATQSARRGKIEYKQYSPMKAVVRKEVRRYFSTPVLIANTWMGLALYLVAVGAICLKIDTIIAMLIEEEFPMTMEEVYVFLPTVTLGLVAFSGLLTYITTTMISLEGKAFNTLKAMPVSGIKVLMGKVVASLLLTVPALVAGVVAMAVRFGFGVADVMLLLVATVAIPFVTEMFGILIDLHYARFDAESDAETVKQSTGVMVSAFAGLGAVILTIPVMVVLALVAGQTVGMLASDILFVLVGVMLVLILRKRGERRYRELVA